MSKLKGLFLDAKRNPQDVTWVKYPDDVEWVVVRNSDGFFKKLPSETFEVMSFDHDLRWFVTGYDVLKAMIHYAYYGQIDPWHCPEQVFFHTESSVAKLSMERVWDDYLQALRQGELDNYIKHLFRSRKFHNPPGEKQ